MKKKDIFNLIKEELYTSSFIDRYDNISTSQIELIIDIYFETILEQAVLNGKKFKTPIGTFSTKQLKPRKGKTPEGKEYSVGERYKLSFRQNKRAKDWMLDITF